MRSLVHTRTYSSTYDFLILSLLLVQQLWALVPVCEESKRSVHVSLRTHLEENRSVRTSARTHMHVCSVWRCYTYARMCAPNRYALMSASASTAVLVAVSSISSIPATVQSSSKALGPSLLHCAQIYCCVPCSAARSGDRRLVFITCWDVSC